MENVPANSCDGLIRLRMVERPVRSDGLLNLEYLFLGVLELVEKAELGMESDSPSEGSAAKDKIN